MRKMSLFLVMALPSALILAGCSDKQDRQSQDVQIGNVDVPDGTISDEMPDFDAMPNSDATKEGDTQAKKDDSAKASEADKADKKPEDSKKADSEDSSDTEE